MKLPVSKFKVFGNSMYPTLKEGQEILSRNWFVKPKIGDLVVVKLGKREIIKRVQKVLNNEIIIQGDNLEESVDSRHFGPIKMENVVGKVVYSSCEVDCANCGENMVGIAGRKDAICKNCGFKLTCCGEP